MGWCGVGILATAVENAPGVQVVVEVSEDVKVAAAAAANTSVMVAMDIPYGVPRLRASMSGIWL